jgi:hypothetical protein
MESVSRGAEWIETRLLAAGPRANPWYQECSSRPIQNGELMSFDTDLVGAYGYCTDMSRCWLCGDEIASSVSKLISSPFCIGRDEHSWYHGLALGPAARRRVSIHSAPLETDSI